MNEALIEARKAFEKGEVPVGAVVVCGGEVAGRGHNLVEWLQDPTAHAEMLAITAAANSQVHWRLNDCILYVTLEPCMMCASAALLARIPLVVFGAGDSRFGACGSNANVLADNYLGYRVEIIDGIMEKQCTALLQLFFEKIRLKRCK